MMIYNDTPVQHIENHIIEKAGVRLMVKREDLNHALISGNKWWKLKYNVQQALNEKRETLLTFGGAFSNHIYSTAAAAHENQLKSIGIIRGEETLPLNHTLSFAVQQHMKLHYVSREEYRKKNTPEFLKWLEETYSDFYMIPEGGSNILAVKGCAEFTTQKLLHLEFDYICLPVGTGGTMAGIISGLAGDRYAIGVPVLKNGDFLQEDITKLVADFSSRHYGNWTLLTSYHHGGYAKVTKRLLDFVRSMKDEHNLPLDPVYTGKLMWAVMNEIEKGRFPRGSTVLVLHTGGLQGAQSWAPRI